MDTTNYKIRTIKNIKGMFVTPYTTIRMGTKYHLIGEDTIESESTERFYRIYTKSGWVNKVLLATINPAEIKIQDAGYLVCEGKVLAKNVGNNFPDFYQLKLTTEGHIIPFNFDTQIKEWFAVEYSGKWIIQEGYF